MQPKYAPMRLAPALQQRRTNQRRGCCSLRSGWYGDVGSNEGKRAKQHPTAPMLPVLHRGFGLCVVAAGQPNCHCHCMRVLCWVVLFLLVFATFLLPTPTLLRTVPRNIQVCTYLGHCVHVSICKYIFLHWRNVYLEIYVYTFYIHTCTYIYIIYVYIYVYIYIHM